MLLTYHNGLDGTHKGQWDSTKDILMVVNVLLLQQCYSSTNINENVNVIADPWSKICTKEAGCTHLKRIIRTSETTLDWKSNIITNPFTLAIFPLDSFRCWCMQYRHALAVVVLSLHLRVTQPPLFGFNSTHRIGNGNIHSCDATCDAEWGRRGNWVRFICTKPMFWERSKMLWAHVVSSHLCIFRFSI